jgi:Ankyrin repeats (many copies)
VVSDQFAKRGIVCDRVRNKARDIIDRGEDIVTLERLGMKTADLKKRRKMLDELQARVAAAPAGRRSRSVLRKPQPLLMEFGDVMLYPTCLGENINPYFASKELDTVCKKDGPVPWTSVPWAQDRWGAMVIVDCGRLRFSVLVPGGEDCGTSASKVTVYFDLSSGTSVFPSPPSKLDGRNAIQMAAWHGRGDVLATLEDRSFEIRLEGLDSLVAVCARADLEGARSRARRNPELLTQLLEVGGTLLAHFAGANNDAGVRCLLALGVSSKALWPHGDGYWELAPASTALHVAAWRANHEVVKTLIAAGAPVNAGDARGRTALQLAVRACIDSYWKYRRKPDSVAALLAAGARIDGIDLPTGYSAIDELLVAQGKEDPGLNREP